MPTTVTPTHLPATALAKTIAPTTAAKSVVARKPAIKANAAKPVIAEPPKPSGKARPTAVIASIASIASKKIASNTVPSKAVMDRATAARKVVIRKTPAAQPVARKIALPLAAAPVVKLEKNTKKHKLVRDSFTIPKAEYTVLDDLKQRAARLMHGAKKSELLRAGVKALAAMSDTEFLNALKQVPAIKTGRPAAGS